jgi:hypothetical protein
VRKRNLEAQWKKEDEAEAKAEEAEEAERVKKAEEFKKAEALEAEKEQKEQEQADQAADTQAEGGAAGGGAGGEEASPFAAMGMQPTKRLTPMEDFQEGLAYFNMMTNPEYDRMHRRVVWFLFHRHVYEFIRGFFFFKILTR